jgi:hypothetical protein
MLRWLLIVFLVAHGLVHVAIWTPRYDPEKGAFDASHSWLIAVVGLGVSTVLLILYFTPWYLFILAVNIALIVGIAFMDWPAKTTVGA